MRVLLGVSGGIAAFKAAQIVRELRGQGHEVRCALTRSAESFVTPLTLEVLTGQPVYRQEYLSPTQTGEELHIEAALWADVVCIAPATAQTLARLALGLADDFLSTSVLAFDGPLVVAPAMHTVMWNQTAVRQNVENLQGRGVIFVGPVVGALASGDIGPGRLAEPSDICEAIVRSHGTDELQGRTVVIAAGPTREALDPVRFLTNRSSGKMGFALAAEAANRGAQVILVSGPVDLATPTGSTRVDVESAREMHRAVTEHAATADVVIMAAAVADFRPATYSDAKLKKRDQGEQVALERNPDILASLAESAPQAIRVGFAAETGELEVEALRKLQSKQAHFIVANDVSRSDIGFDGDDNEVVVYSTQSSPQHLSKRSKRRVAKGILDIVGPRLLKEAELSDSATG